MVESAWGAVPGLLPVRFPRPRGWQGAPVRPLHQRPAAPALCQSTDLARWDGDDLQAIAANLNSRPRKTLGVEDHLKPSTSYFPRYIQTVLLPSVESGQYTSAQLQAVALGVRLSVERTGVGWDNAQQESFWLL